MLDLSDGIAGDAKHLDAASDVGFEIELDLLPLAPAVAAAAAAMALPPARFAAEGGEDYELLAALPAPFGAAEAELFRRECGLALTRIGGVSHGAGVTFRLGGEAIRLSGFDHFL
jgi:thiamine-monophosphate kinase